YRACLEINVEGAYNSQFDAAHYPTPKTPAPLWDSWATNQGYGYPYRGQPSVAYCTEFRLGAEELMEFTADVAEGGVGTWDTSAEDYGTLSGMDGMTDDPVAAPGSGGDRLRKDGDGHRLRVIVKPPMSCEGNTPPGPVDALGIEPYPNQLHAHEWVAMSFMAASDDTAIFRYEVRVSTEPIRDEASFMRGQVAKNATVAAEELDVPAGTRPGTMVHVDMGGLVQGTHYYVGVRAVDGCAAAGDIRVTEVTTPMRTFATVTPCFVATAAYGSPLAAEIGALRRFRDRQLSTHWLGRQLVAAYNVVGPILADRIREHDSVRAAVRSLLSPLVAVAHWLDD
ncbi:MAG TPA: CFI-box-CTERM domain-containing protein, partial [Polyangiales bacterium]|nr:CFI-box-CTERM domain-containing protein [Polyangiales bacterium]